MLPYPEDSRASGEVFPPSSSNSLCMPADPDSLPEEFMAYIRDLERHYLMNEDPIKQSGFYGGAERWRQERGSIVEAVDRDGDFLDAACANGYLLECLVDWAREKGIALTPYGLIIGAYVSKSEGKPARDLAPALQESGLAVAGSASYGELPITRIAWADR